MKKFLSAIPLLALLFSFNSEVFAAELLDVKPVVSEGIVSIEISADIPMTYTYYKVPGQARAVVDIAEADPEKVEPLIVVNKGAVSSISVDKAQISGIVVSRIIFNLVSESDISVTASTNHKLLTVTFGKSTATNKVEASPEQKQVQPEEPVSKVAESAPPTATTPVIAAKEEDPLGLDEPVAKATDPVLTTPPVSNVPPVATAPTTVRVPKLEPVVPIAVAPTHSLPLSIKGIASGESYIEIRANQQITDYKTTRLSKPERLIIDIAATKINQKAAATSINKFGITKVRIGIAPKNIRVVFDTNKASFPKYTFSSTENGLRVNFK